MNEMDSSIDVGPYLKLFSVFYFIALERKRLLDL